MRRGHYYSSPTPLMTVDEMKEKEKEASILGSNK